jgi:spore coat protein U-like protein
LAVCLAVCAALTVPGHVLAETAGVGVTIVAPLQVAKQGDLEFGGIIPASTSETVTLDVSGAREVTGGLTLVATFPAAVGARFMVRGGASALFNVALPGSTTLSRVGGGATDMAVTDFVSSTGPWGSLGADGTQQVVVGATLHVGADQPIGRYTGTFEVLIEYQ